MSSGVLDGVQLHPRNVDEALLALGTVVERLAPRGDARAVFPDVYAVITHQVARVVRQRSGLFQEPDWISRLAGRFAERYLETLAWSLQGVPQDCKAWELSYRWGASQLTFPLQDAALGISAHINFDLALGLWQTIEEFGDTSPERLARYKHDHDAVNTLLAASLPEALERLVRRYACPLTPALAGRVLPLSRWLALRVLAVWREHVWGDVLALVHAGEEAGRQRVVARMHRRSARYGHLFALPSAVRHLGRSLLPGDWRTGTARRPPLLHLPSVWPRSPATEAAELPLAG